MKPADLRSLCLSFTGAEETFPFGPRTSVFKVAGKMFALSQLGADSLRVSVKCEPELARALREAYAAVIPGYHLNKRHWNTVIVDLTVDSLSPQDSSNHRKSVLPAVWANGLCKTGSRGPGAWPINITSLRTAPPETGVDCMRGQRRHCTSWAT